MNTREMLARAAALFGPSGQETEAAAWFGEQIRPFVDGISADRMGNVIARRGGKDPRVMLCAHTDEIALMVSGFFSDGGLRLEHIGGIDDRTLPSARVIVHTSEGELPGVILPREKGENGDQCFPLKGLAVETGLTVEEAKKKIRVGDAVTFDAPAVNLLGERIAAKTMDNRACGVLLVKTAELLAGKQYPAELQYVFTSQEEVGERGAAAAAFALQPELAVVLDADHGPIPGDKPDTTIPMDRMNIAVGPFLQPELAKRVMKLAEKKKIPLSVAAVNGDTGTDADLVGISRGGVPCVLLSLPLRYMHTTVETVDAAVLEQGAALLADFLMSLDESWEAELWS